MPVGDIGIEGMTVSEVKGFGRPKGHTEIHRGQRDTRWISCLRSKLELVIRNQVDLAVPPSSKQPAPARSATEKCSFQLSMKPSASEPRKRGSSRSKPRLPATSDTRQRKLKYATTPCCYQQPLVS